MGKATQIRARERNEWLRQPDSDLLKQCRERRYRATGPGGQHRNKVETAIHLEHQPSGVTSKGEESRTQEENRRRALHRLRQRIALEVRTPFDLESPDVPQELAAQVGPRGSLKVNAKNPNYSLIVATALDALDAAGGSYASAARALGVTTAQFIRFLQSDREVWRTISESRTHKG